jgi:small conductance mechanosensitive channel
MATETNTLTTATNNISAWKDKLIDYSISHAGALVSAVVVVVVGLIAARWIGKLLDGRLSRKSMEPPMRILIVRIVRLLIFVMALVVALGTAGMDVTALIAGIGVAGVGVGLAVQGVLGNLVAGLTIIFTKPFRVGEYIEVTGVSGQVEHIELFSTMLLHSDRSHVMIPNRKLVGEILHNYGHIRQLDLSVGVAYGTDMDKALKLVREILATSPRVIKDPVPVVGIAALGDSSVQIMIRPWTSVPDYGPAQVDIYEAILNQFRANKIGIPFPQREVRMLNGN